MRSPGEGAPQPVDIREPPPCPAVGCSRRLARARRRFPARAPVTCPCPQILSTYQHQRSRPDTVKSATHQLTRLSLYTLRACGRPYSPKSLLLHAQECTAELSFRRGHSAPPTQTDHSRPPRRRPRPLSHTLRTDRPRTPSVAPRLEPRPRSPFPPRHRPRAGLNVGEGSGAQTLHRVSSTAASAGLQRTRVEEGRTTPCTAVHRRSSQPPSPPRRRAVHP